MRVHFSVGTVVVLTVLSIASVVACGSGSTPGAEAADASAGDSARPEPVHIDQSAFPSTCPKDLSALSPAVPFDSVEVREYGGDRDFRQIEDAGADGGLPLPKDVTVLTAYGAPCASATNRDACLVKHAGAYVSLSDWSSLANYRGGAAPPRASFAFYVVTRGDDVSIVSTRVDLLRLLGPLDNPTEAIHAIGGPFAGCLPMREDAAGYSFFSLSCSGEGKLEGESSLDPVWEVVTKMTRDGAVSTSESRGPFAGSSFCIPAP